MFFPEKIVGLKKKISRFLSLEQSIAGAAIIIAVFTVVAKLVGFWRDRLLVAHFGAGEVLDAYYAAFKLPDFVFNTLILGAFSSAFIPIFFSFWKKEQQSAWKLTNEILNFLFIVIFFLTIILIIFASSIVPCLVPGFSLATQALAISFTRIIAISVLFFTLSNVFSSLLNTFHRFWIYSLAPVLYNLGIIVGIIFLSKTRLGVYGLAWGVVLGAFMHCAIQGLAAFRLGYTWKSVLMYSQGVKEILRLMLPRFFGLAVSQVNIILAAFLASFLAQGSLSIYTLASNFSNMPAGLIGIPLSISLFPVFSLFHAQGENNFFYEKLAKAKDQIFYFILPLTVFFIIFRAEIISLILEGGLFTKGDSLLTAQVFGVFSLSLIAQNLIPLLARSFYAQRDTKTPVYTAVISLIVNFVGSLFLTHFYGVIGLALAYTLSSFINFYLLDYIFTKRNPNLKQYTSSRSFTYSFFIALLLFILLAITKNIFSFYFVSHTFLGPLLTLSFFFIFSCLICFGLGLFFKLSPALLIFQKIKRIFR